MARAIRLLEYSNEAAYTKFTVPHPERTQDEGSRRDEALVFELQANPTSDARSFDISLNGKHFEGQGLLPEWELLILSSDLRSLPVASTSGEVHQIHLTGTSHLVDSALIGTANDAQRVRFQITSIDETSIDGPSFSIILTSTVQPELLRLSMTESSTGEDTMAYNFKGERAGEFVPIAEANALLAATADPSHDLANELDSLSLLEAKAESLQIQINAKKRVIAHHLRNHRDSTSLRQLLEECDGLVCAARVVAQKICDRVGVETDFTATFARAGDEHLQQAMASHETSRNCTGRTPVGRQKHTTPTSSTGQAVEQPAYLPKDGTSDSVSFQRIVNSTNPIVHVFAVMATFLGLVACFGFVRRKCMSARKRVDQLADREERRNARAYRRAARRAEIRRRWDHFVQALTRYRPEPEPRIEDYEEKRALILQDAFLEQLEDLENAEKGEIMEAEIRELRHAHEIVATLVRTDQPDRYELPPARDPPPSMIPVAYNPAARSRASTHTLPSYISDDPPDYSSRPETLAESSSSSVLAESTHSTPSASDGDSLVTPPSTAESDEVRASRYTATSSILETSPRVSEETLRTRLSRDTQDL
ncbi:hypothetical protein Tdes44962_MAKER08300 [Teratosphaeria destructans]|uniref:Uncharacterized protein n=1 Tax=Teratosphaeria destructans TaxID=418781 RepID=A0A9W7W4P2_9PEZI|nr:hypothetical protein Tdes44962_MAKER08300 [Teratosphaeria destructans]